MPQLFNHNGKWVTLEQYQKLLNYKDKTPEVKEEIKEEVKEEVKIEDKKPDKKSNKSNKK